MKRVLTSIGIGAATVDTVLPRTELQPGETVEVDVEMRGGNSTQDVEGISFVLKGRVESDGGAEEHELAAFGLDRSVSLAPDDIRTLPVDVTIPLWTPITTNGVSVWLETRLDIDWSRDPTDEDRIAIVPDDAVSALFDALEDLGFGLQRSNLVDVPHVHDRPLAQRFRFRPTDDQYEADLDAIEVTVMPRSDDLRAFVEFDRRGTIADEHDLDFDKQEVPMTFRRTSNEAIRGRLVEGIEQNA